MRLLHPFMPFITEEIWQTLPHEGASIVRKPYPIVRDDWDAPKVEQEFSLLEECRNLMNQERAILNYPAGKRLHFKAHGKTSEIGSALKKHKELIEYMENVDGLQVAETFEVSNTGGLLILTGNCVQVRTSMEDADLQKAKGNVLKQMDLLRKEVERTEKKLGNPEFIAKAPPDVRNEHHERLKRESEMIQLLQQALDQIELYIWDRKRIENSQLPHHP